MALEMVGAGVVTGTFFINFLKKRRFFLRLTNE